VIINPPPSFFLGEGSITLSKGYKKFLHTLLSLPQVCVSLLFVSQNPSKVTKKPFSDQK